MDSNVTQTIAPKIKNIYELNDFKKHEVWESNNVSSLMKEIFITFLV